ncbi:MAG: LytTR family DNA-binding domain-containing protein [Gemmatimonadaceae bacterium]
MTPTSTLRVVIVDDEPLARDAVRLALDRAGGVEIAAECGDGEAAVAAIRSHDPDLVVLDIQMPGLDGFGVIERVGARDMPPVVFVTAYDAHAIRAFEVRALDYVLKPFDDARLAAALERARERLATDRAGDTSRALTGLLADRAGSVETPEAYARRIMVRADDDRIRFITVDAITHLEAEGNYVVVHSAGEHRVRSTLGGLTEQLDPGRFIRIHRGIVVNVDHIRELQPWFSGDYVAILRDGTQLKVSRRYRDGILRLTL